MQNKEVKNFPLKPDSSAGPLFLNLSQLREGLKPDSSAGIIFAQKFAYFNKYC